MPTIRLTLHRAAQELDVDRKTLVTAVRQSGIDVQPRKRYTLLECHLALATDLRKERTRLMRAKVRIAELKAAKMEDSVIPKEEVVEFITRTFAPVREGLLAMPGRLAGLVNPADPAHARRILEQYRDDELKRLKTHKPS